MNPGVCLMLEVVIPAYNAGRFLRQTLDSVAAQTRPSALVTVVDDSSTDDTAFVALGAAAYYGDALPIRLLRNSGTRGPAAARNLALRESRAEFVALLDADDRLRPDHHRLLLAAIGSCADAVASFGDSTLFNSAGVTLDSRLVKSGVANLPASEVSPGFHSLLNGMFGPLLKSGMFDTSACLFRRAAVLEIGLFDESLHHGEDTDLFLRLALKGRFVFTRETVMDKRQHDANLTDPRNAINFCRAKVVTLMKFYAEAGKFHLSPEQSDMVDAELNRALDSYAYHASRAGAARYGDAMHLARAARHAGIALKPRHLTRMMLVGMRGGNG
jgi:glycosyltransferase involved in cell wall biosynthesis